MRFRMSLEQKDLDKFIDMVISKYHFDDTDREIIADVYGKMRDCMAPYAIYKINHRITGIKAIDDSQAAIVAMTLGAGLDKLQAGYEGDRFLKERYILDCLANELLIKMYSDFNTSYSRFHRRYITKYHFIGSDIGTDKIGGLLDELYGRKASDEEQEKEDTEGEEQKENDNITSNEYGVLFPEKSVIFYALLSENPDCACEGICMNCDNLSCDNRMKNIQIAK